MQINRGGPARLRLGIRVIVAYKLTKAVLETAAAVAIAAAVAMGTLPNVAVYAHLLHEHMSPQWSMWLSALLTRASEPRHLRLAAVALALDAVMTMIEGISLGGGWWWGPWVVVVATTTLLPVELGGFVQHGPDLGRVIILAANLAVVAYLARHALGMHRSAGDGS